jgi:hypothetical protein
VISQQSEISGWGSRSRPAQCICTVSFLILVNCKYSSPAKGVVFHIRAECMTTPLPICLPPWSGGLYPIRSTSTHLGYFRHVQRRTRFRKTRSYLRMSGLAGPALIVDTVWSWTLPIQVAVVKGELSSRCHSGQWRS